LPPNILKSDNTKKVAIYGSTGSIGKQALHIIEELGNAEVSTLVCSTNIELLTRQVEKFQPKIAGISNPEKIEEGKRRELITGLLRISSKTGTRLVFGRDESMQACCSDETDMVLNSAVGVAGLIPTIQFILAKKPIALANKESLVVGGSTVTRLAAEHKVRIYPVDSEHSAISQCLEGSGGNKVKRLIITASGGPFRLHAREDLVNVSPEAALKHPTWNMGGRITIDSATLMNKGFEVIEAKWLFEIPTEEMKERIVVVVHPQSIMHGAVEYYDQSVFAQLSVPDMREPIEYALNYPNRPDTTTSLPELNLAKIGNLSFEAPDKEKFGCLQLAYDAMGIGGAATAALNAADEVAVEFYLKRRIRFLDIEEMIRSTLEAYKRYDIMEEPDIDNISLVDEWARRFVRGKIAEKYPKGEELIYDPL
jgi:1-deoxy-D-xylulose-5-phosphate reductoisomerase